MMKFIEFVKSLTKFEEVHIDNKVFKLHYKFTAIMLVIFSVLVTSKQYFGDPIDCYVEDKNLKSVMNTYCWITGTFVLSSAVSDKMLPGMGNEADRLIRSNIDSLIISQKYYQWVCIFLCIQAVMFYVPRFLWKNWERGRLRLLVSDFGSPIVSDCWNKEARTRLVKYVLSSRHSHNGYAFRFFFCEVLNLLNVFLQIVLVEWFLSGEFPKWDKLLRIPITFTDSFMYTFPKISKCKFYKYGPSGGAELRDALCVLPLNVLNEKLFVFLRCWFYFLSILTTIAVLWRLIVTSCSCLWTYLLMHQSNTKSKKSVHALVKNLSYGNFFLLLQLGKNMNDILYADLVDELIDVVRYKKYKSNGEITVSFG